MKKMNSQSSTNLLINQKGQTKTDSKTKRFIFQSSQQQQQQQQLSTGQYEAMSSVTTPQGMISNVHHVSATSPQPRNFKKSMLGGSCQVLTMKPNKNNPPTCTSPYISTQPCKTTIHLNSSEGYKSPSQRSTPGSVLQKNAKITTSPSQRLIASLASEEKGVRRANSNAIVINPAQLNFSPNTGFGLEQKVIVKRQQP